jgi:hypothetical protein
MQQLLLPVFVEFGLLQGGINLSFFLVHLVLFSV